MIHLSKPVEYISQSEPQCKLWTSVDDDVSILVHQLYQTYKAWERCRLWGGCVFWGEGGRHMGTPWTSHSVLL